jgi:hypothetical protein
MFSKYYLNTHMGEEKGTTKNQKSNNMPVTVLKQYIILNPGIKYAKWAIIFSDNQCL